MFVLRIIATMRRMISRKNLLTELQRFPGTSVTLALFIPIRNSSLISNEFFVSLCSRFIETYSFMEIQAAFEMQRVLVTHVSLLCAMLRARICIFPSSMALAFVLG